METNAWVARLEAKKTAARSAAWAKASAEAQALAACIL